MRFKKKNIGILGLGKSGYWSAKLAKSLNNNVFISDSNKNVNQMFIDDLKMLGIDLEIGIHSNQILKSDIIIKSPGIPNDLEIMKKISAEKIPVISEIEFAGKISNTKNICITGTNGKTTTVSLLTEILSKEKNVLKSGNIGIPFSKIVLENKLYDKNDIDYCILELSSFQLEHCKSLKKEISVILNISVDHMDRYDTIEEYFKTKLKIFDNAKYCLFNYDDNFLKKRIDSNRRNTIPFSITKNKGHYYYDNDKICSYEGIDFINDSKSTNIDSVKKALESISKKVILILGGIPKEDDFSEILLFKKNILKIIVYGEAADKVYNSLSKDIDVERIDQFENAVHFALESAIESSVVLLSPACASFDQFNNYQERGIKFKNIVERFYA